MKTKISLFGLEGLKIATGVRMGNIVWRGDQIVNCRAEQSRNKDKRIGRRRPGESV